MTEQNAMSPFALYELSIQGPRDEHWNWDPAKGPGGRLWRVYELNPDGYNLKKLNDAVVHTGRMVLIANRPANRLYDMRWSDLPRYKIGRRHLFIVNTSFIARVRKANEYERRNDDERMVQERNFEILDWLESLLPETPAKPNGDAIRVRAVSGDKRTDLGEGWLTRYANVYIFRHPTSGIIQTEKDPTTPPSAEMVDGMQKLGYKFEVIQHNPVIELDSGDTVYGCQVWWTADPIWKRNAGKTVRCVDD